MSFEILQYNNTNFPENLFINSVSTMVSKMKIDSKNNKKIVINHNLSLIKNISMGEELLGIFSPINSRYFEGAQSDIAEI